MTIHITFGKDQQPGSRSSLISDGVFHAELSLRGRKEPMPFSMVVDMNRELRPPVSAEDLFENCIEFLKSRQSLDARSMLLELAGKMIQFAHAEGLGNLLSFSLTIIEGPLLHMVSYGGHTRLYLVRRGKAQQLSTTPVPRNTGVSGQVTSSEVEAGYSSLPLLVGDKVILCTDGLYNMAGIEEISVIERYDNPTFSAKHLTSIAMGRNVDENASAGVINYGKRLKLFTSPALIAGGIGLVVILAVALALLLRKPQVIQLPEDLGLAVHVSGQLYQVNPADNSSSLLPDYSIVNPGTRLKVDSTEIVHLKLKKRVLATNSTENINNVDLFLADGSEVILTSLDYARQVDGEPAAAELLDRTTIELLNGSFVVVTRDGTRKYSVVMRGAEDEGTVSFNLLQPNAEFGMIGVLREGDQVGVYCLAGSCELSVDREAVPILQGNRTLFYLGNFQPKSLEISAITEDESGYWRLLYPELSQ
jgi:hypothetical protein